MNETFLVISFYSRACGESREKTFDIACIYIHKFSASVVVYIILNEIMDIILNQNCIVYIHCIVYKCIYV